MKVENSDVMETWTLLDTGVRSAAENSALDDVLLKCRNRDICWHWYSYTVSIIAYC